MVEEMKWCNNIMLRGVLYNRVYGTGRGHLGFHYHSPPFFLGGEDGFHYNTALYLEKKNILFGDCLICRRFYSTIDIHTLGAGQDLILLYPLVLQPCICAGQRLSIRGDE